MMWTEKLRRPMSFLYTGAAVPCGRWQAWIRLVDLVIRHAVPSTFSLMRWRVA